MAWFLFIDESGQDRGASPYEVLAGVAVEDRTVWNLIIDVHDTEIEFFGQRISENELELKAKKLLKSKTFRLAAGVPPLDAARRTELVQSLLQKGRTGVPATREELSALGQAKIAFVEKLLETCARHDVRAFASIVDKDAPGTTGDFLRKDYAYLFERFFYFLDERPYAPRGIVVFDELERSQCHLLVNQMRLYFLETATGRRRAGRVIPEPFFVHSDLTTLIQLADLLAYVVSWGVRVGPMTRPARPELATLAQAACDLRYRATRERDGQPFYVWSFAVIDDLRPRDEREDND
ncbi:MAG: DUF3800 domain-containing protein [Alphaproteobacteria bacterium]|nr:DUF3800 domain-containing protein [Alphaproteobacteria bacterium]